MSEQSTGTPVATSGTLADILGAAQEANETETLTEETNDAPATEEVTPVVEAKTETEPDTAKFSIPKREQKAEEAKEPAKEQPKDLKEILKNLNREEVLKAYGLDEFDMKFADYRKNGGDPYKYIEAKGRDYTKVPDIALVKEKIAAENGYLAPDEIDTLTEVELAKYGLHEDATAYEKKVGQVLLKRDAQKIREERMAQDANFQIPTVERQVDNSQQDQAANWSKAVIENPSTKALLQSKRVVADGGEEGHKFSFEVDEPQELVDLWTNPEVSAKYMLNEKGEPDLDKQYLMGLMAIDPKMVINSLINHGKALGEKQRLNKSQNIDKKQTVTPPAGRMTEAEAWKGAKTGKLSDFMNT